MLFIFYFPTIYQIIFDYVSQLTYLPPQKRKRHKYYRKSTLFIKLTPQTNQNQNRNKQSISPYSSTTSPYTDSTVSSSSRLTFRLWLVLHPSPTMSRWRHSFLPTISLFQSDTLTALPLFDHVRGAQESRAWPKNGSSKTILKLQLQPLDLRV